MVSQQRRKDPFQTDTSRLFDEVASGVYKVVVATHRHVDHAIEMDRCLRSMGLHDYRPDRKLENSYGIALNGQKHIIPVGYPAEWDDCFRIYDLDRGDKIAQIKTTHNSYEGVSLAEACGDTTTMSSFMIKVDGIGFLVTGDVHGFARQHEIDTWKYVEKKLGVELKAIYMDGLNREQGEPWTKERSKESMGKIMKTFPTIERWTIGHHVCRGKEESGRRAVAKAEKIARQVEFKGQIRRVADYQKEEGKGNLRGYKIH